MKNPNKKGAWKMESPEKIARGFVKLSLSGEQLERFLNLCRGRGILLENIRPVEEKKLTAVISIEDFRRLAPIHRKTRVHIHILEKRGLPFFLYRSWHRKCFFAGILLCAVMLLWLSGHIWNIHIDGNVKNSTPELLEFLDQQGVIHGINKKSVNCSRIAAMLRKNYPDITFVSARVQGTRLLLTIQEEALKENLQEEAAPCDLVADLDGEIVCIVTRQGVPMMKKGDLCKKGDILISGTVELLNDSQEVVRTEYVPADGDIYVRHQIPYYQEFSLSYKKRIAAGKPKSSWYLHLGNWIIGAGAASKEQHVTSVEELPWKITENFTLPISLGKITRTPYQLEAALYTRKQAEEKAVSELRLYEKSLLEQEITIVDTRLSIQVDKTSCITKGTLTVEEKCGEKRQVQKEEEALEK